jgi:hypothetical protein
MPLDLLFGLAIIGFGIYLTRACGNDWWPFRIKNWNVDPEDPPTPPSPPRPPPHLREGTPGFRP